MNLLKKTSLLALVLLFSLPIICNASGKTGTSLVHLRLNQYYVLYTTPSSPYLDSGRLYLPLRSVSELLGAKVNYDPNNTTADISYKQNKLTINTRTQEVSYNGKATSTDAKPQIRQQSIYVPVRILIDGLGLNGIWDQKIKLLKIQEDSIKTLELFQLASEFDKVSIISNDSFLPLSFTWDKVNTNGHYKMKLSVTAKNISGKLIPEGQEDLHPTYFFTGGVTLETLNRPRPAIKNNEIFTREWEGTMNQNPQYILLEGRTIQ